MDDGSVDAEEDPFTAKMSFEVIKDKIDEVINIPPTGQTSWGGWKDESIIELGCVYVCVQTAGGHKFCPRQGESLSAAFHEQEGRPDQTLAETAEMGILPVSAAWC